MTNHEYKSEIRDSLIRELLEKVRRQKYEKYLLSVDLKNIRLFHDARINFNFPVTALIGPNGGGKSTILGAVAILYHSQPIKDIFRKSRIGDDDMDNWEIGYEIIDKKISPKGTIQAEITFKNDLWCGNGAFSRPVKNLGIKRTVPALERSTFSFKKKLTTPSISNDNIFITTKEIEGFSNFKQESERILGKALANFQMLEVTFTETERKSTKKKVVSREVLEDGNIQIIKQIIKPIAITKEHKQTHLVYVGNNNGSRYSEFNFSAGEASVIRSVAEIEAMPENSLILLEEVENGLHPLAVQRFVEYLIDVANRKKIQIIFTTHSDYALDPIPFEAIWSTNDGRLEQGKLSIETIRAISGQINQKLAIFVEDDFANAWIESIIREEIGQRIDEIKIYSLHGDGNAVKIHNGHRKNPAISFHSLCFIDGDSNQVEDNENQIFRLPGKNPELTIFTDILANLDNILTSLTIACQRLPEKQDEVKKAIIDASKTTRDPHLLFSKIGDSIGNVPETIIKGAFYSMWIREKPTDVKNIITPIKLALELPPKIV